MRLKKGILLVFEGIDGSGKTTQARLLQKRLREKGLAVVYFREPSRGKWGLEIKKKAAAPGSLTPGEELDLFQKDRRENVEKNLRPALEKNKVVILDRYYYSTIAYQGARGLDPQMIKKTNEEFAPRPDLVFVLDIDPGKGLERIRKRRKKDMLFEQEEYLVKVRRIFKSFRGKRVVRIDALEPKQEIQDRIERQAFALLKNHLE